eukprot:GHVS01096163.1.p1 GENE.GHVS01096163.1~~GHVS01096163.1.p1  ORF type:complete len:308 (+),score=110.33 GHVS01096163.1:45-968(+)
MVSRYFHSFSPSLLSSSSSCSSSSSPLLLPPRLLLLPGQQTSMTSMTNKQTCHVRSFSTNYRPLQRGRRRLVHITYPPLRRSTIYKLHQSTWASTFPAAACDVGELLRGIATTEQQQEKEEGGGDKKKKKVVVVSASSSSPPEYRVARDEKGKLMFVCHGYVDKLNIAKLSESQQKRLKQVREENVYGGKLPWDDAVRTAVDRKEVTCLCFATTRTHHLLESFTLDETLELAKQFENIEQAFKQAQGQREEQQQLDRMSAHRPLRLHLLGSDPAGLTPKMKQILEEGEEEERGGGGVGGVGGVEEGR